jgi:hypothetical protein
MITVYIGRDNAFALKLLKNSVALTSDEMAAITNVGVIFDGTEYDYDTYATAFDFTTYATTSIITIALGGTLTTAARDRHAEIVIYTATDTSGVIWAVVDLDVVDVG